MKKIMITGLLVIFLTSCTFAEVGFRRRPITNNLSMPTGHTLREGEFIIGLGSIGFGITDNIQIGTNVLLFLFQAYNGSLKINLITNKSMAVAVGIAITRFNLDLLASNTETVGLTSVSPYLVLSPKLSPKTTVHIGAQYSSFSGDYETDEVEVESTTSGTRIYGGIERNISNKTKFLLEAGYDITFEGFSAGGGFLWGWEKFRLKLGVTYYNPKDSDQGFTIPNIGLWWRFMG